MGHQATTEKGNYYLVDACNGDKISTYHIEAGIAYWHTTSDEGNKWFRILQLYNQLILIDYSPAKALNRLFAVAKVYGSEKAIAEARKSAFMKHSHYHALLGFLYTNVDVDKAISHYRQAIKLTKSKSEIQTWTKASERLKIAANRILPDED